MELSIVISSLIVSVTAMAALRQYLKSKERRLLIEKALDPSLVNIYSNKAGRKIFLFIGIFSLGIALGIITGIILATILKAPGETKEFIFLSLLIFAGASGFVCYYLSKDKID